VYTYTTLFIIVCFIFSIHLLHVFISLYHISNSHSLFLQCWFTANFTIFWASHVMVTCGHNTDKKFYGNCFYWCKHVRDFDDATQCFQSGGSGSYDLTPQTCLCYRCCALEQDTRRALKGDKQSARPCCPLLKLLLIKKIYHLNTLHLYPAKTNKERVTEFSYQAVQLPTSDCSIFTENEGLVQIIVIITNHDFGPDYKLH